METNTVNGPAGKAGKADVRDEREQRKGDDAGKRTSADLLEVWEETKEVYRNVPKRKSAECNLTVQSSLRVREVEEALNLDAANSRAWDTAVRARLGALVKGDQCYAARLEVYKGVNIRIDGRPFDGVALAAALRNERSDILGGKPTSI